MLVFKIFCDDNPTEVVFLTLWNGTVSHGSVETNHRLETSIESCVDLEK